MPNGYILQTVAGVINTIYTGIAGGINYYVPKNTGVVDINSSDVYGGISTATYSEFRCYSTQVTSIVANNSYKIIAGDTSCVILIAEKVVTLDMIASALNAKSIGDILYAAYVDNRANVNYNFTGGTNAAYSPIDNYLDENYSSDVDTIVNSLTANGGVITLNL